MILSATIEGQSPCQALLRMERLIFRIVPLSLLKVGQRALVKFVEDFDHKVGSNYLDHGV